MDRRLAYAIPNIFTASSLICALVALKLIASGDFIQAAWLITLAIILDGFDGKMARMLNATSKLGAQADSLVDFVAFGVITGFLAFEFSLKHFGFLGFFVFIVYVLCGGFRLARFNVQNANVIKKADFMGLPIPAASAVICSFVLFNAIVLDDYAGHLVLLFITVLMSYLMVSRIPYIAVNKTAAKKKYTGIVILFIAGTVVLAIIYTVWIYLICSWLYISYGLYNKIKLLILKHQDKPIFVKKRIRK